MAIRVRAQLRKWFGRGMYPTAEQFSDLFDSFFHKTEDKIPMSGVEGLTDQLNGKYNTAEGRELEKKVQKVTDDLSVHVASSEKAFNEVQNDIEALDGRLDTEIERAKGEEAAIRRELAAGDAATLSSAKSYTDTSVAAEAEERTQGDAATLSSAKTYTDTAVADEAQKRGQGDAATLRAANEHTDAAVAEEASARESGDRATLQSAKDYVDKAIAELVDGSPAALDTLKELSPPWATIRISLRPSPRRSAERSIRSRARAFPPRTTPPRRRPSWRESHRGRTTTGTRPPIRLR